MAPEVRGSNPLSHPMENILNQEKELLHKPYIVPSAPIEKDKEIEFTITIGRMLHPMKEDHYIEYIEVYKNDVLVDKINFNPAIDKEAKIYFSLKWEDNLALKVKSKCNLHGVWETVINDENKQDFIVSEI